MLRGLHSPTWPARLCDVLQLYVDGGGPKAGFPSGWGVAILREWQDGFATFDGWLGGANLVDEHHLLLLGAPRDTIGAGEGSAQVWAASYVLQLSALPPLVQVQYDPTVAAGHANGLTESDAAPHLAALSAQLWRMVQNRASVRQCHGKGHAGHGLNQLADDIVRAASRHSQAIFNAGHPARAWTRISVHSLGLV